MKFLAQTIFPALALSVAACGGGSAQTPPATPAGASTSATTSGATAASSTDPTLPKPADHPESAKVTWKKDAPAKTCHVPTAKGTDLVAGVTAIASGCIAGKLHQLGQPTTGSGVASSATMVQAIPLKAKANHCYRVFGLAEPTVTDFDIAVMDSAGKSAGEDLTDSNDAIVLESGAICFTQDDTVNVNAAVAAGTGKWAVEIWSDE
jgi:hypothetical protein